MKTLFLSFFLILSSISIGNTTEKILIDNVHKIIVKDGTNRKQLKAKRIRKRLRKLELAVRQIQQAIFELQEGPEEQEGFLCTLKMPFIGASFISDVHKTQIESKNQVYQKCLKDSRTGPQSFIGNTCDNSYMAKYNCTKTSF